MQVVPSFAGVQDEIEKHAERYGKAFGEKFDKGFADATKDGLGKSIDEGMKGAEKSAQDAGSRAGRSYAKNFGAEAGKDAGKEINRALARQERESERAGQRAGKRYAGHFAEQIKKALTSAQREVDAIKVDANIDPALAGLATIRTAMAALRNTEIGVDIDGTDAIAAISSIEALLDVIQRNAESVQVRVDAAKAMTDLATVRAMVEQLDTAVEIELKVDRKMGSFEKLLKAKVAAALDDLPPVDLQADDSDVNHKISAIRAELYNLGDAQINIDLSTDDALIRLRTLLRELEQLDGQSADVGVRVDAGAAYRELAAVFGVVEALEAKDVNIQVDADTHRANEKLKETERHGLDAGNAFRAFNFRVLGLVGLGPGLIPILGAIAAGLLAIGPAAAVGAAGLGVLLLGFSGIGNAVTALGDVQKSAAKDSLAAGKTMRAAGNAVRDAELGVLRAREAAAASAESSGRRVADALRAQERAERQYIKAQEDALQAQRDLISARDEAQNQLEDLQLRARGGALAERAAALDLAQAQADYISTFADGASTNVERERAAIALEREKIGYDEARLSNQRLAEQKAEADRTGVEGTDTYQRALERVAGANQTVEDAQQGVVDAQRDVADAQRDAARASRDASRSIQDATRSLTDAQTAYGEALTETSTIGSAANQRLAESMAALGPAGREFAFFIHSLRDDFRALRDAAQAGLLPGVEDGIKAFMESSGPQLLAFVSTVSTALGDLFRRAGEAFGDPRWQQFFGMMNTYAPIFLEQFGAIFGNIIEGFRNVLMAMFPFTEELGGGLEGLTQKWADWTAGFSDPNSGFQQFLDWVREVGPGVLAFFGSLFEAVKNIAVALAPFGEMLMTGVTAILAFIGDMDPELLGSIVVAILGLATAFQLATGAMAFMATATALLTGGGIGLIILGIGALVTALIIAYNTSDDFRRIVDQVFKVIADVAIWLFDYVLKPYFEYAIWIWGVIFNAALWAWENILKPVFKAIGEFATWLWIDILEPIFTLMGEIFGIVWGWMKLAWENIGKPIFRVIASVAESLWGILAPIFQLIGMAFELLWFLVSLYWKHIGKPMFDAFIEIVGFLWRNVIGPVVGFIIELFGVLFGFLESTWNTVGKPVFDLLGAVVQGLVEIFQGSFDGIKAIWDALLDVLMTPIVFVVETVLNKGLIAGINKIAGVFTDDKTWIEPLSTAWIPGRAEGGIIPGSSPHKRADNVLIRATAGEFMHDVDATQYYGTGLMQAINERLIPREVLLAGLQGRAYGGMIDPLWGAVHGHFPQARLTSSYRPGDPGLHGRKQAVDLGGRSPYPNPVGMRDMLEINLWLARTFPNLSELIHTAPGAKNLYNGKPHTYNAATQRDHRNHVHAGARGPAALLGGEEHLDSEGQSFWDIAWDFISKPFDTLKKIITDVAGDFGKTDIGDMLLNIPVEFARNAVDSLLDFVGGIGNSIMGFFGLGDDEEDSGGPSGYANGEVNATLYDKGGYLPPGLSMVMNATGKPEPVLTAEELDLLREGGDGSGGNRWEITVPMLPTDSTPADVAAAVLFAGRQLRRGGKYKTARGAQ